jgi:hypothetical protein
VSSDIVDQLAAAKIARVRTTVTFLDEQGHEVVAIDDDRTGTGAEVLALIRPPVTA